MTTHHPQSSDDVLTPQMRDFYRRASQVLVDNDVPFLVGGAYALGHCSGIHRHTKDFDVFVNATDAARALRVLGEAGLRTELPFPHWLGKAWDPGGDDFIDVIFSSGNGVAVVDDDWFKYSRRGEVLGMDVALVPVEEMIWSKSFILERERYDGADVAHLLLTCADRMDWDRLLRRFGDRWRILFTHLVLFGFIYPGERGRIPEVVLRELSGRFEAELSDRSDSRESGQVGVCQGTLVSREQYLIDVEEWGYRDARRESDVRMSTGEIEIWTDAIAGRQKRNGN